MEAWNERPTGLYVLRGGRHDPGVSDEDREREIIEEAEEAHRDWLSRLPRSSSWLLPFREALRALSRWVRNRRRRGS